MKRTVLIISTTLVAGCAGTTQALLDKPPFRTYESSKEPTAIAQCIALSVPDSNVVAAPGRTVVSRNGEGGAAILAWEITSRPAGGSKITFWRVASIVPGRGVPERCF